MRLVEHIQNILIDEGFSEVSGEIPDLGLFSPPIGRSVKDKLVALVKHYPHADVIFVHRDADNVGSDIRETEIFQAAQGVVEFNRIISVIPVTMLETWLLADLNAIKRVAGNAAYRGDIGCIPATRRLEAARDTKQILMDALCEASGTQGARLSKFKKRFAEMRARLTVDLDANGPVRDLPSYQAFRQKISDYAQGKLNP
ncbi:hypothetical protein [Pseudomonas sp. NS1(2017)]|uniref:hypothetical protein n=1 Tax=Pseudomonas sp. NS1(2017) TaxID=2025658 RepID=UPI0012FE432E|nr:hypothetical protein [Pseudomonas sp. NS1(2017)]